MTHYSTTYTQHAIAENMVHKTRMYIRKREKHNTDSPEAPLKENKREHTLDPSAAIKAVGLGLNYAFTPSLIAFSLPQGCLSL